MFLLKDAKPQDEWKSLPIGVRFELNL